MKRFLLAAMAAVALVSLNGCYADVAPYSYGPVYTSPGYYSAPVYTPTYAAPVYYAPRAYRPAPRVYVAPPRAAYRSNVVYAPRHGRSW